MLQVFLVLWVLPVCRMLWVTFAPLALVVRDVSWAHQVAFDNLGTSGESEGFGALLAIRMFLVFSFIFVLLFGSKPAPNNNHASPKRGPDGAKRSNHNKIDEH